MSFLEIISRLCEVTAILTEIIKSQQIVIEQSNIEESIKQEFRKSVEEADKKLDVLGYNTRKLL